MEQPLVSVILTSYNQPALLERAFNSLIQQTYKNIEIIIVDDCSTDKGNKKLIEKIKTTYPQKVKVFYQRKNAGIPKNKNTGFRLAAGEYITYLDGDDTYYEDKISSEIETFLQNPGAGVVYSNFDIKDMDGEMLSIWATDVSPSAGYIFKDIILNNFPNRHAHRYELFKKEVLYELCFYDETFSVYHDLDFMIRYSLKYRVAYNNYIGSTYFKNPGSIVGKTKAADLIDEELRVLQKNIYEIKNHGLYVYFQNFEKEQSLNKLFYADDLPYSKLLKLTVKYPLRFFKILKIKRYIKSQQKRSAIL